MYFLKFSFAALFLSSQVFAQGFDSRSCLDAEYKTEITHEGKFFGLIKNDLKIEKSHCHIKVTYKNILETVWNIDLCREPIHMKITSKGSQSVYKREGKTCDTKKSDYCRYWNELDGIIQDHGLIFAKGDREDLNSPHGQTYCVNLLLKKYLAKGFLFSKYSENVDIFSDENESCAIPESEENKVQPVSSANTQTEMVNPEEKTDESFEKAADGMIGEEPQSGPSLKPAPAESIEKKF